MNATLENLTARNLAGTICLAIASKLDTLTAADLQEMDHTLCGAWVYARPTARTILQIAMDLVDSSLQHKLFGL